MGATSPRKYRFKIWTLGEYVLDNSEAYNKQIQEFNSNDKNETLLIEKGCRNFPLRKG